MNTAIAKKNFTDAEVLQHKVDALEARVANEKSIITDTDMTRRVVAQRVAASSTPIAMVMTPNPTCVSMMDSAMAALGTMVENHFQHLPVVDDMGAAVGLLDIAKCLNDAIDKLEKTKDKSTEAAVEAVLWRGKSSETSRDPCRKASSHRGAIDKHTRCRIAYGRTKEGCACG